MEKDGNTSLKEVSYIEVPAVHGGFQLKSKRTKRIKEKAEERAIKYCLVNLI